jgi:hypothetical protein
VVADRGMISAETVAELEARRLLYILGVRERSDKLVRELVLDERPRSRAAEKRDEGAAPQSITTSARASMVVELLAEVPIAASQTCGRRACELPALPTRDLVGGEAGLWLDRTTSR